MAISLGEAIDIASDTVERYRPGCKGNYEITDTYHSSGRWKISFTLYNGTEPKEVVVRLDDQTGNLAKNEGHSLTSKNLFP